MTREELKAGFPDIYAEIRAEGQTAGYQAGLAEGKQIGMETGAQTERDRIKAVEDMAITGHEALVAEMKFDGKTTGPEAAVKVLQAEKALRSVKLEAFRADGVVLSTPEPVEKTVTQENNDDHGTDKAKTAWDKNPALRAEYGDDYDAYVAYLGAESKGLVKIYKGKGGN